MKYACLLLCLMSYHVSRAQSRVKGVIADERTRELLPYATIRLGNTQQGTVSDINGVFTVQLPVGVQELHISYAGYTTRTIRKPFADTIWLKRTEGSMSEVVITPPYDKIKRIINLAIDNKKRHNPDKYDVYACHVYYKMKADVVPTDKTKKEDTSDKDYKRFTQGQHVLFGETYSKRSYKRPGKLQEIIIASRLSGFEKTYFTNLVTSILPFHVNTDELLLNGINYIHPIANGWQSRYEFNLDDELLNGTDTTFMFSYYPKKGAHFNSLRGIVYINSNGYAISHITTNSIDSNHERYMKMEQNYKLVDDKWFPAELNYDFIFKKYPSPEMGLRLSGHSIVDSISFSETALDKYSAAYPVKLHDSVDLRPDEEWQRIRKDTLNSKEKTTYVFMDSLSEEIGFDKIMEVVGYAAATGRVPVKFIDIDLGKLFAFNAYEKTRLGLGLYTNDKLTKYLSVGGWFGYGFKDKQWKYGGSARIFPLKGKKEYWFDFSYFNTYQNTGNVTIHRELDNNYFRNLLLDKVDRVEGYAGTLHARAGYMDIEMKYKQQDLSPQYSYTFDAIDLQNAWLNQQELSVNLRYAYGEKRAPIFGYYFPVSTKYPVLYADIASGVINAGAYNESYIRAIAAITYKVHINRWGKDQVRVEGGILNMRSDTPLPRSFLMAANGYRAKDNYIYAFGGFLTMYPYTYFNDRYAALLYRHDFDRMLFKTKFSAPYISIAHNLLYGSLEGYNMKANSLAGTPATGYHESGLMLNRIARLNYVNIAYLDVNAGAFYHWNGPFNWKSNGVFVLGLGFGL